MYDVYGIGNALVDMEYEVTPEQLAALNIDKGVMTLVDELRQGEITAALKNLNPKKTSGGSSANTLVTVAQLGGKGFYSCKVANDETGGFFMADLLACGLDTNLQHQHRSDGITGKCLVLVTPDADRTMNTFLGISGSISTTEIDQRALNQSKYIYTEGYLVTSPTGKEAAVAALILGKTAGAKTSFSLSDPNMAKFFRPGLLEIIGAGVDLLFANEAEALALAQTESLEAAIAYLKTIAHTFALTQGPKGSLVFDGETLHDIAPVTVEAIDTVGAGDTYAGAFLYGLTHGMDYAAAGHLASQAAAKVVTQYGPRLAPEVLPALLTA
ncbi:adenosine kinase [Spirulina major CS-329]|uniref:adenosine kinase n=1 Tax=Spirulina TaxID=1154 RepID=UPI00232B14F2|nr:MULTISPECIES: adenosine kinase [Spirulina]MDB9495612.1 adenosine kinase [Spirulina subsalsa CS-330]MDB9503521.1 adenosine kinase [Spirulina major CS-329]